MENTDIIFIKKIAKYALLAVIGIIAIIMLFGSFRTVGAGERGIKLRFGAVVGQPLGEGLHMKVPFIEEIVKMDIKTQKEEAMASAASKDLQTVSSQVALNYGISPESVGILYQTVGVDYKARIIDPKIQESVKASTARFTAEELITKREEVRDDIKNHLTEKLAGTGIVIEDFSIIDFDFSKSFNDAIEAKVTAEQNALAAKNKLSQVQYEAQQAVEAAKGTSEAIKIEGAALINNPSVIQLRAIEKWNGTMPQVTGGGTPFISFQAHP